MARRTFFHSKSSTGATPHTLISRMETALKTNCAVETRPGSGSAFKQSLLTRSIEAEDIEYIIITEMAVLDSLPVSSGMLLRPGCLACRCVHEQCAPPKFPEGGNSV